MSTPKYISDDFQYNVMLGTALAQFLCAHERHVIRKWIEFLRNIPDNAENVKFRNDYMWFLLIALQVRKIVKPFNVLPDNQPLAQIKDVVGHDEYIDVLQTFYVSENFSWIDQMLSKVEGVNKKLLKGKHDGKYGTDIPPSKFLNRQPKPKNGMVCYMGAFSDQE